MCLEDTFWYLRRKHWLSLSPVLMMAFAQVTLEFLYIIEDNVCLEDTLWYLRRKHWLSLLYVLSRAFVQVTFVIIIS